MIHFFTVVLKMCADGTVGGVAVFPGAYHGSTPLPSLTRQGESQSVGRHQSQGKFRGNHKSDSLL